MTVSSKPFRLGLIGARGYVGTELIRLLADHPSIELGLVSSREREGLPVHDFEPTAAKGLRYVNATPEQAILEDLDVLVLALPNGMAAAWAHAFDLAGSRAIVLDLSADFRFDSDWHYGLPELNRRSTDRHKRISNPGCYATAMQLAIAPMRGQLAGAVACFGVSGYSGAGTVPSANNDPDNLRDNLIPYTLTGHIHEREVVSRLGCGIHFMPHVAPHFRGLSITASLPLTAPITSAEAQALYRKFYQGEPLIGIQSNAPWLSTVANTPSALIGGFTTSEDGNRLVVVSVLDNLLKGAASQALQNINLALGLNETTGIL